MPSMTMDTVLPGFIEPTPTDVPQAMTSPASKVRSREMRLTNRAARISHRRPVILPLLVVQNRPDDEHGRIDIGCDHRTEYAERVEALARVHCAKPGSLFRMSTAVTSLTHV